MCQVLSQLHLKAAAPLRELALLVNFDITVQLLPLECFGVPYDYYRAWWLNNAGQIALVLAIAAIWYAVARCSEKGDALARIDEAASVVLLGVFLWYPGFCKRAFEVLRCRRVGLDPDVRVLSVDYSVDCGAPEHAWHQIAAVVCLAIAVAIPVYLIRRLWPHRPATYPAGGVDDDVNLCYHVAAQLAVGVDEAREAIAHVDTVRSFSFMTGGLSARYQYWEAVDMLRKLCVVGVGTLFSSRPGAEAFAVLQIACLWLMVQIKVKPYRFPEVRLSPRQGLLVPPPLLEFDAPPPPPLFSMSRRPCI